MKQFAIGSAPTVNPSPGGPAPEHHGRFSQSEFFQLTKGWSKGKPETVCGGGSTMAATESVRRALPKWIERYEIRSLHDAGAGDLNWIRSVDLGGVQYRAFDLLPRAKAVEPLDITSETLPACDAILCRHVLNHLTAPLVAEALERFRQAATYLIATTYQTDAHISRPSHAGTLGAWMEWNLEYFDLGRPLESAADGPPSTRLIALWKLK